MPKTDAIEAEGTVTEILPNMTFKVRLDNGYPVTAHLSGKLKMNFIRVVAGDRVTVELSPYDPTKGRIIWRSKSKGPVIST